MKADLVVIGAGPAGLAAALAARQAGIEDILIVERDTVAGGILPQCIHSGFGLRYFKEELTGPAYAERFIDMVNEHGIRMLMDTMVISVRAGQADCLSAALGRFPISAGAIVLAMGCRERTRFSAMIPGTRPSGVLTAGLAQRYVNIEGKQIGRKVMILGSGDIGLIMARRMTLEGAEVVACVELLPYSGGLSRNIVQCLEDYDIPLLLSHTVVEIRGKERLSGVTVAGVDANRIPIPGTEVSYDVDTLLLSVGLVPENELSVDAGVLLDERTKGPLISDRCETTVNGVFACGNVVQVHDLVDFVSEEGEQAGASAARYLLSGGGAPTVGAEPGEQIRFVVPQRICLGEQGTVQLSFRVGSPVENADVVVTSGGRELLRKRYPYLLPGEMARIAVPRERIQEDIRLSLEVRA